MCEGPETVSSHLQLAWTPERAEGVEAPQRVRMQLEGSPVDVLPLWVCVHQHHDDGEARWVLSIWHRRNSSCRLERPSGQASVSGLSAYQHHDDGTAWRAFSSCETGIVNAVWRSVCQQAAV